MRLYRHVSGTLVRPTPVVPPTQANLDAIAAWDEADEQAQGILGLRLSTNLRTHLGLQPTLRGRPWIMPSGNQGYPAFMLICRLPCT
jgi:hypothetical protein